MNKKSIVKRALQDYQAITGLRAYIVEDNTIIQSASEKNYFCKCLKVSKKALEECEICTKEAYGNAKTIKKECIYSCHAGLIKWAVPVFKDDYHCVIVSEGIVAAQQVEDDERANAWVDYLCKTYNLDKKKVYETFKVVTTMNEDQMQASINLLKDLIEYHFSIQ